MTRVHEGKSDPGFSVPDSIESATICRKSGNLAVSGVCSADPRGDATYTEYFAKGTAPTEVCNNHIRASVCAESGKLPTPFCPDRTTGIFMAIPSGETAETDDSVFALPGTCTIHSGSGTIINPNPSDNDPSSIFGPGYVPETTAAPATQNHTVQGTTENEETAPTKKRYNSWFPYLPTE